jgi:hypothetical protein
MGDLRVGKLTEVPKPIGELKLHFKSTAIEDLWIALTWGK